MESEADDFHERVRAGFLAQAKEEPRRWLVLDAQKSAEELMQEIVTEFSRRGWLP